MTTLDDIDIREEKRVFPAAAILQVTNRCGLKCSDCAAKDKNSPPSAELSLKQWMRIVDQFADMGAEYFAVSGGEPLMWPYWRELCSYIRGKNKDLSIVSNGYLTNRDDIRFLKEIGLGNMSFIVDGWKETHNRIRNTEDSFEYIMTLISLFKAEGIHVAVSTLVNKDSIEDLIMLGALLEALEVDLWQVQIAQTHRNKEDEKNRAMISEFQYIYILEFLRVYQHKLRKDWTKLRTIPSDLTGFCHAMTNEIWRDRKGEDSTAGSFVIGVKSNGDVVGCETSQSDCFPGGNLNKRDLEDIWNGDDFSAYRHKFNSEKHMDGILRLPHSKRMREERQKEATETTTS